MRKDLCITTARQSATKAAIFMERSRPRLMLLTLRMNMALQGLELRMIQRISPQRGRKKLARCVSAGN